jgi:hypothetical protein
MFHGNEVMSKSKVYPPSAAPEATRAQMPNEAQNPNVKWNSKVEGYTFWILAFGFDLTLGF